MKPWSIRWLLLGVSAAVLVLPALSLVLLRSYTGYLVRRTEEQLLVQGVLIVEAFRASWLRETGRSGELDGAASGAQRGYAPIEPLAEHIRELSPREPTELPSLRPEARAGAAYRSAKSIEPLIQRAQRRNLSAVRVLDRDGCVVATTRGDSERCLKELPEVKRALSGHYAAVLRPRVSDEPPPPLSSISRRGEQRLFIALPVVQDNQVIAVVRLSRTAESGLEWLWKNRRSLLGGVGLVLTAALLLSLVCASLIARPLERMATAASGVSNANTAWPADVVDRGPRELRVLGSTLAAMTEKLARRASYIAQFAANVSHELKTPLTSIRGAAELLRDEWQGMDEPRRQRFLTNILADAERTEMLVAGLLELARIENPPQALESSEPVRLDAFREALQLRYPEAVDVSVEPADAVVAIAPAHLHSAVGNLIDNALRYRRKEPVRVRMVHDGTRLHVEVEDDGKGISPANRSRVFDRFFTTERDRGGTGLGLAIVRAIAESRGGTAHCESGPAGTRFLLVL